MSTVAVIVTGLSESTAIHQAIWQSITNNLAAGNIEQALTLFSPGSRARYRTVLNDIASALPGMFSNFPPIHPTKIGDTDAEYFVVLPENSIDYGYYIYFTRGSDGVWRVQGL